MRHLLASAAVLLAAGLAGCRSGCPCPCPTGSGAGAGEAAPPAVAAPAARPKAGDIVDHRDGARVSFEALVERLSTASVVYVGEQHDQAEHHAFQARVLRALLERWKGRPVALGMEMFQKPFQAPLDAYVRGAIDEKAMLAKTEWATRWGFGWEMYAPMLRLCRERGVAVVALNAPREVTHTVGQKGLDGLSAEQRAALPPLGMDDAGHRAFVKEAFGAHGASMPADRFERFYTAQVIWEEVMSSSVAEWLAAHGEDARMVVVVGGGHVGDRFGVPARAAKKSGRPYLTVMAEVAETGPEAGASSPPRLDVKFADYSAWFVDSAEKPANPPRPTKAPPPKPNPGDPAPTKP